MAMQILTSLLPENFLALYIATFVTALCVGIFFLSSPRGSRKVLPPGPWSLPVIGNIFLFGASPHKNVTNLSKHYGKVFSMKLGSRDVVILNSVDVVKEALVKRVSDFSGRPPLHTFVVSSNGGRNVAFTDFGSKYANNRRAIDQALQALTSDSEAFSEIAQLEGESLVQSLLSSQKEKFNPARHLLSVSASFLLRMFFGADLRKKHHREACELMTQSTDFIEGSAVGNTVDFMPWVKTIFHKQVLKVDETVKSLVKFVRRLYSSRMKEVANVDEKSDKDTIVSDYLTKLVHDRKKSSMDELPEHDLEHTLIGEFDDDNIVHLIADSFGGGYEKLSTALRWCIAYLVAYPDAQEQLYKEIKHVKGSKRISLNDKKQLPLLEATVMEVLRRSCFLPFALPHSTIRDTSVGGYNIPKDTIVFVNLWACCHDPQYFDEPFKFNPIRFMDKKQQKVKPHSCMIAFSEGDRKCPGEGFAKSALFIMIGTLVQNLKLRNGTEEPMEDKFGLTLRPKNTTIYVETRS